MTSATVVLRFVGEESQFSFTEHPPAVGDVHRHDGSQWEVVEVRDIGGTLTATLRRLLTTETRPARLHEPAPR